MALGLGGADLDTALSSKVAKLGVGCSVLGLGCENKEL